MKSGLLRQFLGARDPRKLEPVEACLESIRQREGELHAWAEVNPQPALSSGPLNGIPFGAKDIYETSDLRTEYGSPLFQGRHGEADAELITLLRQRGAVLLGKTQTTAFAYYDPPPTRNPLNPAHTPGGSSSGSAAAVAAGMAPFALGTQTQGSILRPASYCGICGFKPTYGLLPMGGILPFAPSLDTAGFFTQTADDMLLLWQRLGNPVNEVAPRRLGSLQTRFSHIEGWRVDQIELPFNLTEILLAVRLVNSYEGARTHQALWRQHGDAIGVKLSELVREGLQVSEGSYETAVRVLEYGRLSMADVYKEYPVVISDAATGPAPLGLDSTGDPSKNAPWTALHGPAIAIPVPGEGLPIGLQLTAAAGNEDLLLETARLLEDQLN